MGAKSGPCTHCGITATPLWRRGPPEKPILCNACGSRWRHRGTLAGYMPMQVTGLSTCHVPTGFVAPDEPVAFLKPVGGTKRKERYESEHQQLERLRERREKDGYETDGSELSGHTARRKKSPSASPNSVLPPVRIRAPAHRASHARSPLLSDSHASKFYLSDLMTSPAPFADVDADISIFGAEESALPAAKRLDAGQYICGLVVRTRVEALGGPGRRAGKPMALSGHSTQPNVLTNSSDAKDAALLPPPGAHFALPSWRPNPAPSAHPSWSEAPSGLAQLNIAKLQGSDFGNGSPHRASFSQGLLFKGTSPQGLSLNEFMARNGGEKRAGELAGAHDMPGSYDSLDSGTSLVLDETRAHPMVDLNPPPEQEDLGLVKERGEKDLNELHRMFSEPIWDSLAEDGMGDSAKDFGFGGFSVPPADVLV